MLNALNLPQGRIVNPPLDATGRAQASALGAALASGPPIARVGSSPRVRAVQTADAIADAIASAARSSLREASREDLDEVEDCACFACWGGSKRAKGPHNLLPHNGRRKRPSLLASARGGVAGC